MFVPLTAVVSDMTRIGSSDLDVFPLALGGNVFGWTADRDAAFAVLDAFVDGGGDFIDTADSYSAWVPGNEGGESETIIGAWLASRRPQGVVVATKVSQHPAFRGLSAGNVRRAAEASLARLGVDEIDLYYAHFDDESVPLEETVEAFGALVTDGLVRHVAVSNYTADRIRQWIDIADRLGVARPVAVQPHYNLVHRNDVEDTIIPVAEEFGLSLVPYYALASGFLTGKYRSTDAGERGLRGPPAPRSTPPRLDFGSSTRWMRSAPRTTHPSPRRPWPGCGRSRPWWRPSRVPGRWIRFRICSPERGWSCRQRRSSA